MKKEIPWNLIISKLQQRITVEEDRQLLKWLDDVQNREVFDELQQVWKKVQNNASGYVPDSAYYWKELSKRIQFANKKKAKQSHRLYSAQRWVVAACIVAMIAFSYYCGYNFNFDSQKIVSQTYSTSSGKSKVTLPDGTIVWLHSQSSLSYQTDYNIKNRRVTIVGAAFFDVTHNKKNPFIVQTSEMEVQVYGTKFNVESYVDSMNVSISLLEGSISLKTPNENRFIVPGETAVFNKQNNDLHVFKEDVSFVGAWASEEIIFTDKPLSYICKILAKRYDVKINLDSNISSEEFVYTFTLHDEPLNDILTLMSSINPIVYKFDENKVLTITKQIEY